MYNYLSKIYEQKMCMCARVPGWPLAELSESPARDASSSRRIRALLELSRTFGSELLRELPRDPRNSLGLLSIISIYVKYNIIYPAKVFVTKRFYNDLGCKYTFINTKYGIRNTIYEIRSTEYEIRNTKYGIRNTECEI